MRVRTMPLADREQLLTRRLLWLSSSPEPAHLVLRQTTLKALPCTLREASSACRPVYQHIRVASKALSASDDACGELVARAGHEATYLRGSKGTARLKQFFGGYTTCALQVLSIAKQVQLTLDALANLHSCAQAPFSESTVALLRAAAIARNVALADEHRADGARAAARTRNEAAAKEFDRAWTRVADRMIPLIGENGKAPAPELGSARPRVSDEDSLEREEQAPAERA